MRELIVFGVLWYYAFGLVLALVSLDNRNRWGAFLFVLCTWPYMLSIEGTPRMGRLKRWLRPRS